MIKHDQNVNHQLARVHHKKLQRRTSRCNTSSMSVGSGDFESGADDDNDMVFMLKGTKNTYDVTAECFDCTCIGSRSP